jgi:S-formylglutathione hydrolase FrmB
LRRNESGKAEGDDMAFAELRWFSKTLGKQVGTYVILPDNPDFKPPFATYYLLHGLSDDYTIWHRRTRIEVYAQSLPLIVVMPDGFRGFYTNNDEGPAYATYVAEELPAVIERTFPAKSARGARAVGGLSMGGYGALRIGLGYPDRFASVNSHSGALMHGSRPTKRPTSSMQDAEWRRVFGPRPMETDHDLVHLARQCEKSGTLPKIRIDCGTDDFLIEDNRAYHKHLEALRVPHEYEEFPGAHTWEYWDQHVRTALAFHAKHLKLKVPAA